MEPTTDLTILVPIDVSTGERPPPELLALLRPATVVLVGWHPVPDQTALEQMREEHEEEAVDRVETIANELVDDGVDVETLVVFTRDRAETVDRVADEYDCHAVLVPRDVGTVDRVFVPLRGDVNLDAILWFVGALLEESHAAVTLFHATPEDDEDPSVGELLLDSARERLIDAGIDSDRLEVANLITDTPVDGILDAAADHDVLVIGESEPSLIESIIGDVPTRIIERSDRPVLVVRDVDD